MLFSFLLTTAVISASEPESFIPGNSPQVVRVNVNRIVQLPWFSNLFKAADEKCREISLLLDELKKHNIEPSVFFAGDLWITPIGNTGKEFVILLKTALPEARFAEFFNAQKTRNKNLELDISQLNGHNTYTVKYAPAYKAAGEKPFLATYMANDVIAVIPFGNESAAYINQLQADNNNALVKTVDRKKLCAMISNAVHKKSKFRSINATADLTGAEQRDITLNAAISYKNAKTALRKAMEMQFIAPSFAGLLFGNDQKLMEELTNSLQIVPIKEKVNVSFTLTKSVQEKITAYLAKPENVPALNISPEELSNFDQP